MKRKSRSATKIFSAVFLLAVSGLAYSAAASDVARYRSADTQRFGLPFSDATQAGDVLYLSGQIGVLPGTLTLAPGGMEGQARQTMENIGRVLEAQGATFDDIFKCTIMLADMSKWADFNKVYVSYFPDGRYPARSAFGANGLALGGELEVECLAKVPAER